MGDAKRARMETKIYTFTKVMFKGKNFNLVGKKTDRDTLQVTGLVNSIQNRIEMTISFAAQQAEINNFFYPAGNRIDDFRKLRSSFGLEASFVHETMTILCLIALHCHCRIVFLEDAAQKGPFKLSNKRFMGPSYLDYYGKYYGFIKDADVSDLDDAVSLGNSMQEDNKEVATSELIDPIMYKTPEDIVHNYFVFSLDNKDSIPLNDTGLCMDASPEPRFRHMDPEKKEWIVFDKVVNTFKKEEVKFYYGVERNEEGSETFTIYANGH
jgi:hypothetical protein